MAFFKKWKNNAKQSKLSEEWSLSNSAASASASAPSSRSRIRSPASHHPDSDTDSEEPEAFDVRYLGATTVDVPRSEEATAEAVKSILTTAKISRAKPAPVQLCISPRGIEMFDASGPAAQSSSRFSGEPAALLQVSIYKISYCSADAAHPDVFAFVGAECGPGIDALDEQLTCYAFVCGKRKVAQRLALTVAHSFEQAFRHWQDAAARQQWQAERRAAKQMKQMGQAEQKVEQQQQQKGAARTLVEVAQTIAGGRRLGSGSDSCSDADATDSDQMLIDFGDDEMFGKARHQAQLQNTWVSFDDDDGDDGVVSDGSDGRAAATTTRTTSVWDTTLRSV